MTLRAKPTYSSDTPHPAAFADEFAVVRPYLRFLAFSFAGALIWVGLLVSAGHFFGGIPAVRDHFSWVVLAIVALSLLPIAVEYAVQRLRP